MPGPIKAVQFRPEKWGGGSSVPTSQGGKQPAGTVVFPGTASTETGRAPVEGVLLRGVNGVSSEGEGVGGMSPGRG